MQQQHAQFILGTVSEFASARGGNVERNGEVAGELRTHGFDGGKGNNIGRLVLPAKNPIEPSHLAARSDQDAYVALQPHSTLSRTQKAQQPGLGNTLDLFLQLDQLTPKNKTGGIVDTTPPAWECGLNLGSFF